MNVTAVQLIHQIEAVNKKGAANLLRKGVSVAENAATDSIMESILSIESNKDQCTNVKALNESLVNVYLRDGQSKALAFTKESGNISAVVSGDGADNVSLVYENGMLRKIGNTDVDLDSFHFPEDNYYVVYQEELDFVYREDLGGVCASCRPEIKDLKTEFVYVQIDDEVYEAFLFNNTYNNILEISFENPDLMMMIGLVGDEVVCVCSAFTGKKNIKIYRKNNYTDYEILLTTSKNKNYVNTNFVFYKDFESGNVQIEYKADGVTKQTVNVTLAQADGALRYNGGALKAAADSLKKGMEVEFIFTQMRKDGKTVSFTINTSQMLPETITAQVSGYQMYSWRKLCVEEAV